MAATPLRHFRATDDLISAAVETAAAAGRPAAELGVLVRAGLALIAQQSVSREDLADAIDRAELQSGWPAREGKSA